MTLIKQQLLPQQLYSFNLKFSEIIKIRRAFEYLASNFEMQWLAWHEFRESVQFLSAARTFEHWGITSTNFLSAGWSFRTRIFAHKDFVLTVIEISFSRKAWHLTTALRGWISRTDVLIDCFGTTFEIESLVWQRFLTQDRSAILH